MPDPFDTFFGVPIHPLAVHFGVVLVLAAAALAAVVAVAPSQRPRLAGLLVITAVAAATAAQVTAQSGRVLAGRLGIGEAIDRHQTAGTVTSWVAVAMLLVTLAWYRWGRSADAGRGWSVALVLVSALAVVGVVVTGHIGAELVWGDVVQATEPPG